MPDNDTVNVYAYCTSFDNWELTMLSVKEPDKIYTIRHEKLSPEVSKVQGSEYGFTCTCDEFKENGKCKHIVKAPAHFCGWDARTDNLEPIGVDMEEDGVEYTLYVCPRCQERPIQYRK